MLSEVEDGAFMLLSLRKKQINNLCIHKTKVHYAKGLCTICYHDPKGIVERWMLWNQLHRKKPIRVICGHTARPVRARSLCNKCYKHWKLCKMED
jgi:hypothetical protein